MGKRIPNNAAPYRAVAALSATLVLAACSEEQMAQFGGTGAAAPQTTLETVEQEVERPDVFQVVDLALWDGRPSLGGIWVAHAKAQQPERVIVVNEETGAEVKAALFHRERTEPGPAFQLSSEAATKLGMLPGAPARIRVTALRLETVEIVRNAPAAAAAPAASGAAPGDSTLEPVTASEILAVPRAEPAAEEKPVAAAQPAPPRKRAKPAVAAETPAGSPARPYVQVATMSVKANADALVEKLVAAGLKALAKPASSGGAPKYIVLAGPAATEAEAVETLAKIRAMGFADAFRSRGR
ncbi:MAG: SPOR domain-containing protein [Paracoccaceae bacterium]